MKYAIFSDIHANLEALQAFLKVCDGIGIDQYVCLGDTVGYGADPNACVEIVRGIKDILVVKGNHDEMSTYGDTFHRGVFGVTALAGQAIEWTINELTDDSLEWLKGLPMRLDIGDFEAVHSSPYKPGLWKYIFNTYSASLAFQCMKKDMCFIGHSHSPVMFTGEWADNDVPAISEDLYDSVDVTDKDMLIFNVGSVGQPRDGNPDGAFVIYDTDTGLVTLHRFEYDIEKARQKILSTSLPEKCGNRLVDGI